MKVTGYEMPDRLVLNPPAHLYDTTVGEVHHVKGVSVTDGMVEVRRPARAIALSQVGGDDTDGPHPGRVLLGTPRRKRFPPRGG
jgi:hypothetical protein